MAITMDENTVSGKLSAHSDMLHFYQGGRWFAKLELHPGNTLTDDHKHALINTVVAELVLISDQLTAVQRP